MNSLLLAIESTLEYLQEYGVTDQLLANCGWQEIPKHGGIYWINENGHVWTFTRMKVVSPVRDTDGYQYVRLTKNKEKKRWAVHRLVCICFHTKVRMAKQVNHKDFDKTNNHKSNLEWSSPAQNIQHQVRKQKVKRHQFFRIKDVAFMGTRDGIHKAVKESVLKHGNSGLKTLPIN